MLFLLVPFLKCTSERLLPLSISDRMIQEQSRIADGFLQARSCDSEQSVRSIRSRQDRLQLLSDFVACPIYNINGPCDSFMKTGKTIRNDGIQCKQYAKWSVYKLPSHFFKTSSRCRRWLFGCKAQPKLSGREPAWPGSCEWKKDEKRQNQLLCFFAFDVCWFRKDVGPVRFKL